MNAVSISVNAATGGNASGSASAQAAKASTLPAFAQVMAEKQAAVSAPKENAHQHATESEPAASANLPSVPRRAVDSAAVSPKNSASGVAIAAKKSDASGKSANDASASKNRAQNPVQVAAQVPSQVPLIIPGLNEATPWVAAADLASAAPKNLKPTNDAAGNAAPIDPAATVQETTSERPSGTAGTAAAQLPGPAASELPSPIAADLQNLPVSAANAPEASATGTAGVATNTASTTDPVPGAKSGEGQKNVPAPALVEMPNAGNEADAAVAAQSLPVAGNDSVATNVAGNSGNAAGSQATAATSQTKPQDLSAAAAAVLPMAIAEPGPAKGETAPKIQARRSVQEILQGAAEFAGKEAQAAARVSANAAKDVVSAIKGKSGANGSAAPIAAEPAASAKNETPASVKPEPVAPEVAETPENTGSAKSGSNIKGNSSAEASANSSSTGVAMGSKDSSVSADLNAVRSAMPAGQNDPVNLAASAANAVPAPSATTGRDSGRAMAAKAGDASDNSAPAAADADDMAPQPNESRVVNVAQLTGSESHSQVRIAMQADQLGQVELHATVHGQLVGAAITVEKKEAHAAMAAEMPSLQQALESRQFRVGEVVLMQGGLHSTAGDAGNAAMEQQRRGHAGTTYQQVENETTYEVGAGTSFEGSGIFDDSGRLSVRA